MRWDSGWRRGRLTEYAGVEHKDQEERTLLEVMLRLHGDFRRRLEALRVTPLQAGVILYLLRHPDANMNNTAAAMGVRSPTLTDVIDALVRKRLVTRRRALHDTRTLCLRLSRQGQVVAGKIKNKIRDVRSDLTPMKEA